MKHKTIKDVSDTLWNTFKSEAAAQGLKLAEMLGVLLNNWTDNRDRISVSKDFVHAAARFANNELQGDEKETLRHEIEELKKDEKI